MSGHTPGPWTTRRATVPTDGAYDHAIVSDGQVIAEAFGRSAQTVYHDSEANARLISAAPELLEACKRLLNFNEELCVDVRVSTHYPSADFARAAIAKAEGRS